MGGTQKTTDAMVYLKWKCTNCIACPPKATECHLLCHAVGVDEIGVGLQLPYHALQIQWLAVYSRGVVVKPKAVSYKILLAHDSRELFRCRLHMLQPMSTELKKLNRRWERWGSQGGEGKDELPGCVGRISTMLVLSKLVVTEWPDSSCVSPPTC
jgi:hypothetical protein